MIRGQQENTMAQWGISEDVRSMLNPEPFKFATTAEAMFHELAKQIADFEAQLDDSEEVGALVVGGPNGTALHISGLEYVGRDLIVFHGTNEHRKVVHLLQHVGQVNVLLTALPKVAEKAHRIGFTVLKEA
jgi:hypothetical protein